MTFTPDAITLPSTRSARNVVRLQSANGTSTKPASAISLNSTRVTNICTASTKNAATTPSQASSRIAISTAFTTISGNPISVWMSSRMGWAAATPVLATKPGRSRSSGRMGAADAVSPRSTNDEKMMSASNA